MHVPSQFKETETQVLQALIASHPLGTWAACLEQGHCCPVN